MLREQAAERSAGETSACRPTSTHAAHCLMCDLSEMICGCHDNTPNRRWSERRTVLRLRFKDDSPFTPSDARPSSAVVSLLLVRSMSARLVIALILAFAAVVPPAIIQ